MLTEEQYATALRLAQSYMAVDPTPDSRYGKRLSELLTLIGEYERAHRPPLTHEDIQAHVGRKMAAKRGAK